MNLTPIRVRGKRKPLTEAPAAQQPHKARRSIQDIKMSRHTRRQRASLESLPQEILENILLYSCNVALPRSSPVIGAKLSGRATLLRLFIWGFHETWDQWFGIPTSRDVFYGPHLPDSQAVPCDGDAQLQTALLNLPWVTIDFILQAQQTWADRYAQNRWYQHCIPWQDDTVTATQGHSHVGGYGHFNAGACFEADYQQFRRWPPFRAEQASWSTQDVHPSAKLPTSLITGPWDDEKQRRLFWLCRGGMGIDLDTGASTLLPPWEDRWEGLQNAVLNVSEPNVVVANCLLGGWLFMDIPQDVVRKELHELEKRIEWGADSEDGLVILRRVLDALSFHLHLPEFKYA